MRTKKNESEATRQASAELQVIVAELQAIKGRLLATEKRLRAAEGTAAVVGVDPEGTLCTVEGWAADMIGDEVPELVGEIVERIGRAADPNAVRAGIHEFIETERKIEARWPKA